MPNPKRKHTRARRDKRRASNWTLTVDKTSTCPNCGGTRLPHRICQGCGYYKDRVVMPVKEKPSKEEKQQK
jgi:large subunit ribosomal protein L32